MNKKIFTSLSVMAILLASGGFAGLAQADSVYDASQTTNQSNILKDISSPIESYNLEQITVNPYHTTDESVTGQMIAHGNGHMGGKVTIEDMNRNVLGKFKVDGYNTVEYSIKLNQEVPEGTTLYARYYFPNNAGTIQMPFVVLGADHETDIPAPIVEQPVYENDTVVKGRGYNVGNDVVIKNSSGQQIGSGKVGSDLNFSVTIPPQPAYSEIYVTETDGKIVSKSTEVMIHEGESSSEIAPPTVNQPVYEGDTLLTGIGSKIGNEIIIKTAGGAIIGAGTVDVDLSFTVAFLPQPAYNKLYVVEKNGTHTSKPTEVIVHEAHLKLK